jgi:hypothetical protein
MSIRDAILYDLPEWKSIVVANNERQNLVLTYSHLSWEPG